MGREGEEKIRENGKQDLTGKRQVKEKGGECVLLLYSGVGGGGRTTRALCRVHPAAAICLCVWCGINASRCG